MPNRPDAPAMSRPCLGRDTSRLLSEVPKPQEDVPRDGLADRRKQYERKVAEERNSGSQAHRRSPRVRGR